jgi:hypothetical protein
MPSELLKAAVWGSISMRQGGPGTPEQIHSPLVFSPGVFPRLATNRTGARRARRSSVVRDSDEADHDFVTIQKIRRESTKAGFSSRRNPPIRVADPQETHTSWPVRSNRDVDSGNAGIREAQNHIWV